MISAAEKEETEVVVLIDVDGVKIAISVEVEETGSIFLVEVKLVMVKAAELSLSIDREDMVKASVFISVFSHTVVVAVDAEDVFVTAVVDAIS